MTEKKCLEIKIAWKETDDPEYPYSACMDGETWTIRLNDFPQEPLYTLLMEDRPVIDFDDWPENWLR